MNCLPKDSKHFYNRIQNLSGMFLSFLFLQDYHGQFMVGSTAMLEAMMQIRSLAWICSPSLLVLI